MARYDYSFTLVGRSPTFAFCQNAKVGLRPTTNFTRKRVFEEGEKGMERRVDCEAEERMK